MTCFRCARRRFAGPQNGGAWRATLGFMMASALSGCAYRERELVDLADNLCKALKAPTMCHMLHDRISTLQWWETQADLGLALFVAISLLAFATGGGGAVSATQGDQTTGRSRTKRFAKYAAASATLVGVLTVIQNTLLPADFGTMSALAKRGKRQLEETLSVLNDQLPDDPAQRRTLIQSITTDCDKFDDIEKQLKHETPSLSPATAAHAIEKTTPWAGLNADPDKLCFLGFGVADTLPDARECAARMARSQAFDFVTWETMKGGASFTTATNIAGFVTSAAREPSGAPASRYDVLGKLYQAYVRLCVGRVATAEGLAALIESSGIADPATKTASEILKKSAGLPDRYYQYLNDVYAAIYRQAQNVLSHPDVVTLVKAKVTIMADRGSGQCANLRSIADRSTQSFLFWNLLGVACENDDAQGADRAFVNALRINESEKINDVAVMGSYAEFLRNRDRKHEATEVLLRARKLNADDPWISWMTLQFAPNAPAPSAPAP